MPVTKHDITEYDQLKIWLYDGVPLTNRFLTFKEDFYNTTEQNLEILDSNVRGSFISNIKNSSRVIELSGEAIDPANDFILNNKEDMVDHVKYTTDQQGGQNINKFLSKIEPAFFKINHSPADFRWQVFGATDTATLTQDYTTLDCTSLVLKPNWSVNSSLFVDINSLSNPTTALNRGQDITSWLDGWNSGTMSTLNHWLTNASSEDQISTYFKDIFFYNWIYLEDAKSLTTAINTGGLTDNFMQISHEGYPSVSSYLFYDFRTLKTFVKFDGSPLTDGWNLIRLPLFREKLDSNGALTGVQLYASQTGAILPTKINNYILLKLAGKGAVNLIPNETMKFGCFGMARGDKIDNYTATRQGAVNFDTTAKYYSDFINNFSLKFLNTTGYSENLQEFIYFSKSSLGASSKKVFLRVPSNTNQSPKIMVEPNNFGYVTIKNSDGDGIEINEDDTYDNEYPITNPRFTVNGITKKVTWAGVLFDDARINIKYRGQLPFFKPRFDTLSIDVAPNPSLATRWIESGSGVNSYEYVGDSYSTAGSTGSGTSITYQFTLSSSFSMVDIGLPGCYKTVYSPILMQSFIKNSGGTTVFTSPIVSNEFLDANKRFNPYATTITTLPAGTYTLTFKCLSYSVTASTPEKGLYIQYKPNAGSARGKLYLRDTTTLLANRDYYYISLIAAAPTPTLNALEISSKIYKD